jgi:pimeloyl-ACP methyl ester carboxylesterase
MGAALKPDFFNSKINFAVIVSPVVRFDKVYPFPFHHLMALYAFFRKLIQKFGWYDLESMRISAHTDAFWCRDNLDFCAILKGYDTENMPIDRLSTMTYYGDVGTAWGFYEHYAQIGMAGRFQRMDYGHEANRQRYGSLTPPIYDLSLVKVPTALVYGTADFMWRPEVVQWLNSKDRSGFSTVKSTTVLPGLSHNDFFEYKDCSWFEKIIDQIVDAYVANQKAPPNLEPTVDLDKVINKPEIITPKE